MDERQLLDSGADWSNFHWTASKIVLSMVLFIAAGLCEIGGGWLVWKAVRGGLSQDRHWYRCPRAVFSAALGGVVLVAYGFLPTLQPPPTFGRLYAVYGGFFIVLSYLWGWAIDQDRPDRGTELPCLRRNNSSLLVKRSLMMSP